MPRRIQELPRGVLQIRRLVLGGATAADLFRLSNAGARTIRMIQRRFDVGAIDPADTTHQAERIASLERARRAVVTLAALVREAEARDAMQVERAIDRAEAPNAA
ncbi:hypothetical protein [Roseomonas chloroacetimidivorans]|uniref:hypothetical protein n=1 Tax=Roseomonas chloroacetimidivorans TaxID=1766656 RepID=UPI003C78730F